MKNILVAVYGTLRLGQGNHRCMGYADGEYQFTGKTKENYNLYNLGAFPSVSLANTDNNTPVTVEVFAVDEAGLTGPLDGLEGYPHFYNRTLVTVVDGVGQEFECWLYHIDEDKDHLIESGDWLER